MAVFYFGLTVIILMNVVIAIMNHAMKKATYYEPLSWLCNRFRAGMTVETLSIAARDYREQVDLFPQYLYYAVPPCRTEEFKRKYPQPFEKESPALSVEKKDPADIGASCSQLPAAAAHAGSFMAPQKRNQSLNVIQSTRQGRPIAVKTATNPSGAHSSALFLEPIVEGLSDQTMHPSCPQREMELCSQQPCPGNGSMDEQIQRDDCGQDTRFTADGPLSSNGQVRSGTDNGVRRYSDVGVGNYNDDTGTTLLVLAMIMTYYINRDSFERSCRRFGSPR